MNVKKVIIIPQNELDNQLKTISDKLVMILTKLETSETTTTGEISYLTRKETAKLLKVSYPTLLSYVKRKIIPSNKIGGKVLFEKCEVLKAVNNIQITK